MSEAAPHKCPHCGSDAYIPFIGTTRCTDIHCRYFDRALHDEAVGDAIAELEKAIEEVPKGVSVLNPDWEEEETDPRLSFLDLMNKLTTDVKLELEPLGFFICSERLCSSDEVEFVACHKAADTYFAYRIFAEALAQGGVRGVDIADELLNAFRDWNRK